MGRLGWTADQALDTPLPYIHAALQAQAESQGDHLRNLQRAMAAVLGVQLQDAAPATPDPEAKAAEDLQNMKRAYRWFKRQAEINAQAKARRAGG